MEKRKYKIILGIVSALFLIGTAVGIFLMRDMFKDPQIFRNFVEEHYFLGAVILVAVSILQVLFALVPGELVEIASGYAFGHIVGTALCFFGIMAGSCLLMFLIRKFGRPFAEKLYDMEKLDNVSFLKDKKERNVLTFILFLMPGTPKDLMTLFLGFTDMKITTYFLLTSFTRLFSIWVSSASGDGFGEGNLSKGFIFMGISAAVSLAGFIAYHFIRKKKNNK